MNKFNKVVEQYQQIQNKACRILSECDGEAIFSKDEWTKEIGKGLTRVITNGAKIEKGAINFSKVSGIFNQQMAKTIGVEGSNFSATGVSSIFHPQNPFSPIIHMNIRYFELDSGVYWFGGGIDLTPHYVDENQARYFHSQLKKVCDRYNINFYQDFKQQADNYFFIEHRDESRGVGGIFFDHLNSNSDLSFDELFEFTLELGLLYPKMYAEILDTTSSLQYEADQKEWQNYRRSRYVEFNLIYDRGTKFGLESNGNAESILVSMPPEAKWIYNYNVKPNSNEEKTMNFLKKGINWVNSND